MKQQEKKLSDWLEGLLSELPEMLAQGGASLKQQMRMRVQNLLLDLDCVPWDEFESLQTMAVSMQERIEQLTARIATLEAAQKKSKK
jgi:BMFP domain-containing protein YqiC